MIGLVGLGRMGQSIAARFLNAGIDVIAYDKNVSNDIDINLDLMQRGTKKETKRGALCCVDSLSQIAQCASIIWLMVPAGKVVDDVIKELLSHKNDIKVLIDGGNSFFKDSIRRYKTLQSCGISFLDCGTSGGLHGRDIGFCLMIGGDAAAYRRCEIFFKAIAAPEGYAYVGPSGAGHYVKMVHNGIEYGLLQAYAEGFHVLKSGHYPNLDLEQISGLWNHGSIIRSWILELTHQVFTKDQDFGDINGAIAESGTGRWTVEEAEENTIPVDVIKEALTVREKSRKTNGNYATKLVALLRQAFGGHAVNYK